MNKKIEEMGFQETIEEIFGDEEVPSLNTEMDFFKMILSLEENISDLKRENMPNLYQLKIREHFLTLLVEELKVKFGISKSRCLSPSGIATYRKDYYTWYEEMHRELMSQGIICSACPFTTGEKNRIIPCKFMKEATECSNMPWECAFFCNEEEIIKNIQQQGDETAVEIFLAKIGELKQKWAEEILMKIKTEAVKDHGNIMEIIYMLRLLCKYGFDDKMPDLKEFLIRANPLFRDYVSK